MKQATDRSSNLLPIYFPLAAAFILADAPAISYLVAWGGSLFIFYQTWFSPAVYHEVDLPIYKQVMRPIFLLQFIFAGFMAISSIFYFLDHAGFRYFSNLNPAQDFQASHQTILIAKCQRLALLAHVALVTGITIMTNREPTKIKYKAAGGYNYLIWLSIVVYVFGTISARVSGLNQIAIPLMTTGISCAAVLFSKGILNKNIQYLAIGSSIFFLNFVNASLSGYKEPIIVNIIILAAIFFPYYKKTILILTIPIAYVIFYFLPTYNTVIRASWSGDISAEEAQTQAIETLIGNSNSEEIDETNWAFLTTRLSEISMFTQFVDYVPKKHDYYGFEILENSIYALIPRVFWSGKPNIEEVAMERVYDADVVNRNSVVSAKTRPVVDGYLSAGIPGVFFTMLIYGLIAQGLCNRAEEYFGGYELGCVIIFNSLYQTLWRGNNFEFMINNIFYAYIIMWLLWFILRKIKVLEPVYP